MARMRKAEDEVFTKTSKEIYDEYFKFRAEYLIKKRAKKLWIEEYQENLKNRETVLKNFFFMKMNTAQQAVFMPPAGAAKLLALMLTPDRLEEVLGDFDESYGLLAERHGVRFARNWYRWQVMMLAVRGAGKLTWRAAKAWFGDFGSA
jgi:hypothetical protein